MSIESINKKELFHEKRIPTSNSLFEGVVRSKHSNDDKSSRPKFLRNAKMNLINEVLNDISGDFSVSKSKDFSVSKFQYDSNELRR